MDDYLNNLVQMRDKIQRERKRFDNRIRAIQQGRDEPSEGELEIYEIYFNRFKSIEEEIDCFVKDHVKDIPIYPFIVSVKGIGPLLAAQIISQIDITKADTVSSLWKYAGYGVTDGKADRPRKGQKLTYNKHLKTIFYKVGVQFLRNDSPYRLYYDKAKEYYQANRTDWTAGHIHNASLRKMIKLFISHLWHVWRELEGLPTRLLYVQEKLGHDHIITPKELGWIDKAGSSK